MQWGTTESGQRVTLSNESRHYMEYLERHLHDSWERSGGPDDAVSEQAVREFYPWPSGITEDDLGSSYNFNSSIQTSHFRAVTITSNYTALPFDFINAVNGSTITFPQYPEENSVIIVRNGDGSSIKLNGNGKNINGSSTGVLQRKSTSIEFYYFIASNEWFAK